MSELWVLFSTHWASSQREKNTCILLRVRIYLVLHLLPLDSTKQIAKEIYDAKLKGNPEILQTIKNKRREIRRRTSGAVINSVGSLTDAKFWFENMTYFQVSDFCLFVCFSFGLKSLRLFRSSYFRVRVLFVCLFFWGWGCLKSHPLSTSYW